MKQSIQPVNDSVVHRLHRKWRLEGRKLLAEAREERRRRQAAQMLAVVEQTARLVQGARSRLADFVADPQVQHALAQIGETQLRLRATMNSVVGSPEFQRMLRQVHEMQRWFEAQSARPEVQAMIRQLADPRIQATLKDAEHRLAAVAKHDPSLRLGIKPRR